jgi:hypothetical protein
VRIVSAARCRLARLEAFQQVLEFGGPGRALGECIFRPVETTHSV